MVLLILAFVLLAIGLLGAVIPVLPGPPLSFIGLLLMQWSGYGNFTSLFLWIWAGITVIITVLDYVLPSFFAKRFGGSRAASIGSFLGLVAGIFLFPPWGMIIGPFIGAFIGELIANRHAGKALKVAFGAFLAFIAGSGAKLIAGGVMIYYAVKALL
jgi:uncharacterized protein YqgC (DUF456 family)